MGFVVFWAAANSPARMAAAAEENAEFRFWGSSTKTRAPECADRRLETPLTSAEPSPCNRQPSWAARSLRFMVDIVAEKLFSRRDRKGFAKDAEKEFKALTVQNVV